MTEIKTKATEVGVDDFLDSVPDLQRREDGKKLRRMMERITGQPATMWGPTMIGFGRVRYTYETGHSGEMFRIGFAPRKPHLVIYGWDCVGQQPTTIARLGKSKTSKACLYVNKLDDIDLSVLRELLEQGLASSYERYPAQA